MIGLIYLMIAYEVLNMNGYITVQEAAEKWRITPRQVQILCKEDKISGATRMSRIWIIPEDAVKPTINRRKAGANYAESR